MSSNRAKKGSERMSTGCLLIEIGCEELPAKLLPHISDAFLQNVLQALKSAGLQAGKGKALNSPRRLAVQIEQVERQQQDTVLERKGPAVERAFVDGQPTPACIGFARACGIEPAALDRKTFGQIDYVVAQIAQKGQALSALLPEMLEKAIKQLPVPKTMRWGSHSEAFIRPVHWLVAMLDDTVLDCCLFGCQAGRQTYGHRVHCKVPITLEHAENYVPVLLNQGHVMVDMTQRRQTIVEQMQTLSKTLDGSVVIDEALLIEVTGLVEWPVALQADFDKTLLDVPAEALIAAMHSHQKCFHVVDDSGKLLPHFITISNLNSTAPDRIVTGNERVMRARLNDADFFYRTDLKTPLRARLDTLKHVVFQEKLGSIYNKAERLSILTEKLSEWLNSTAFENWHSNGAAAAEAGLLAKADLATEMVYEFPALQGIMGYYYATTQQVSEPIALAMREHYLPRFSGDDVPQSVLGILLALADRLDTLVGIFAVGLAPTGDKDPFALRRAALSVLRIIHAHQLPFDIRQLVEFTAAGYTEILTIDTKETTQVVDFILERLKSLYQEEGVETETILAVLANHPTIPIDIKQRIDAVQQFQKLGAAKTLIALNKRLRNILRKADAGILPAINETLLQEPAEQALATQLHITAQNTSKYYGQKQYDKVLETLIDLEAPIRTFFDHVMVMTEDMPLRHNRLSLLQNLRQQLLQVADLSVLSE